MTRELPTDEIIKEIHKRFDYSLNYQERLKVIDKINNDFGDDLQDCYFYYKTSNLNKYNNKIAYDRICSVYDRMSEYILFADIDDQTKEDLSVDRKEYPYTQESNLGTIRAGNEISLESYVGALSRDEQSTKKHYDDQNHATYKLKDFEKHIEKCPYVQDYTNYNKHARSTIKTFDSMIKQLNDKGVKTRDIEKLFYIDENGETLGIAPKQLQKLKNGIGYTKNNSIEIDKDIIAIIRDYFGIFYFKSPLRETEKTRKLDIDFMDNEHISGLIKASCLTGYLDKFDKYIDKLDMLASKANLTKTETNIYDTFRKGKKLNTDDKDIKFEENIITISECARMLDTSQSKVDMLFNSLVKKICDKYEEIYEDYYFTFIAKGTYKKCSKCGEVKLANERYFRKRNDNKGDGYRNECRSCERGLKSGEKWG